MKPKSEITIENVKEAHMPLNVNCYLSNEVDIMTVNKWYNGEGYTVTTITTTGTESMQLTHGDLKTLKQLIKALENA
jgi:hypothetical protein